MDDELPSARLATVDEAEFRGILREKDANNTRRATNGAVKIFRTYLKAKNMPETFENFTNEEFDDIVGKFYVEVRQENGDKYQRSSLFSIRYGLNRYLSLSRKVDIMKDTAFQVSQKLFTAVTKDLKREGEGAVKHYPPIEETDLRKMHDYFNVNDNVKLPTNNAC
jgi:hypothetical protein